MSAEKISPENPQSTLFDPATDANLIKFPDRKFANEREREMFYVMQEYYEYKEKNGQKFVVETTTDILNQTNQLITNLNSYNSAKLIVGLPYRLLNAQSEKSAITPQKLLEKVGIKPQHFNDLTNSFEEGFQKTTSKQIPPKHILNNSEWLKQWQEQGEKIIASSKNRIFPNFSAGIESTRSDKL